MGFRLADKILYVTVQLFPICLLQHPYSADGLDFPSFFCVLHEHFRAAISTVHVGPLFTMISLILLAFASLIGAWTIYSWYCLYCNYRVACKIGIPLRVIPISHENPLWMVVDKKIFIPIFERFPFGSGNFTRYNWRGWEFADKYRSHMEMGDVFMMVTPGRNWLYLCNAESLVDVFQRRSDFPRPLEIFGILFFRVTAPRRNNG